MRTQGFESLSQLQLFVDASTVPNGQQGYSIIFNSIQDSIVASPQRVNPSPFTSQRLAEVRVVTEPLNLSENLFLERPIQHLDVSL